MARETEFAGTYPIFYDRQMAWIIAERNGQILRELSCETGVLYSEHLY